MGSEVTLSMGYSDWFDLTKGIRSRFVTSRSNIRHLYITATDASARSLWPLANLANLTCGH